VAEGAWLREALAENEAVGGALQEVLPVMYVLSEGGEEREGAPVAKPLLLAQKLGDALMLWQAEEVPSSVGVWLGRGELLRVKLPVKEPGAVMLLLPSAVELAFVEAELLIDAVTKELNVSEL